MPEVHSTVHTGHATFFRRMLAFGGPAYLVSVGYMDPGNWAGDLGAGSKFGYQLLWVIVLSNLMAILLQTLAARLGIASGRDLAQACREAYPRGICNALWILCEIAIAACDLAEVLGAAIALNLLFHLPLVIGVILTAADTIVMLWLSRYGIRMIEAFILGLIGIMAACFLVELGFARPALGQVFSGIIPHINSNNLYYAVVILGATVMPHNLYLHSALVQTRRIGQTVEKKREACRFNFYDSFIALNGALIVNAAILVLAAAVFFSKGIVVEQIDQAQSMLSPLLGTTLASILFSIALLASGQSSTLTGTFAGQIVMEGFLNLRMTPWLRRLMTRTLAIVPAVFTVMIAGEKGTFNLLLLSQVIISMQLPFAVIPLIRFTADRKRMGEFASGSGLKLMAWISAAIILILNFWLAWIGAGPWVVAEWWRMALIGPVAIALVGLLGWITFPGVRTPPDAVHAGRTVAANLPEPVYRTILVPLDHTDHDRAAIAHAAAMARLHSARLYILHVEEDVTSQFFGALSSTAEIHAGKQYFQAIVDELTRDGIPAELTVVHGGSPKAEIVRMARRIHPDLLVMAAHGHRGIKDLIFGNTINAVRHEVAAPVLVIGK